MIRNSHTYLHLHQTIHRFRKKNKRTQKSNRGSFEIYRCEVCGITGNKYGDSHIITIHKQYGQKLFSKCKLKDMPFENPAGKYVRICSKMIPCTPCPKVPLIFPDYRDSSLSVGTVHRVINPGNGHKNDNRGVWVKGINEPIKLNNHEFIYYKKSRRTRFNTKRKGGRRNFTPAKKGGRTKF